MLLQSACACLALLLAGTGSVALAATAHSVELAWTAPGDDADTGQASGYDLRYSRNSVPSDTAAWWGTATRVTGLPHPSFAGYEDSKVVTGLQAETTYYFVLRCYDEAGNQSGFSNVAVATTTAEISAAEAGGSVHAYPNPSTDLVRFRIHVDSPSEQRVHLRLFDPSGHVIATIAEGTFPPGDTIITWPRVTERGDRVAPGYYESIGVIGPNEVRERLILLP